MPNDDVRAGGDSGGYPSGGCCVKIAESCFLVIFCFAPKKYHKMKSPNIHKNAKMWDLINFMFAQV